MEGASAKQRQAALSLRPRPHPLAVSHALPGCQAVLTPASAFVIRQPLENRQQMGRNPPASVEERSIGRLDKSHTAASAGECLAVASLPAWGHESARTGWMASARHGRCGHARLRQRIGRSPNRGRSKEAAYFVRRKDRLAQLPL